MECPYCNKSIEAMTGLQEVQKFQKHLPKCKKNPKNKSFVNELGEIVYRRDNSTLYDALQIRAESGQ